MATSLVAGCRRVIGFSRRRSAWLCGLAVTCVVLYGGALRFEALTARFGLAEGHPELRRVQRSIRQIHPRRLNWARHKGPPYEGDPYRYLYFARQMARFYDASVREPVFVGLTKVGLYLLEDRDLGVSLASCFSSVLLILATYVVGRQAFSAWVGLLAGLGVAVERYVIGLSIQGWRDDTFALLVVLWCGVLVRFRKRPTFALSLLLGLAGGAAGLTRITALSFLLPGYGWLLLPRRGKTRRELELVGMSVALSSAVVAPFLVNCGVAYGDPFYAVNYHTAFYLTRAGVAAEPSSWVSYLRGQFLPFELVETLLVGLTSYPFFNKWNGFEYWWPGTGVVLSWLAVFGGLLMLQSWRGRAVLLILFTSLVPFAFTYRRVGGAEWRFTLHAYPFYLIASALALTTVLSWLDPEKARQRWADLWRQRKKTVLRAALFVATLVLGWALLSGLHYLTLREAIQAGRVTIVKAGYFDGFVFCRGWSRPKRRGNITVRVAKGASAVLRLPLKRGTAYRLDFRLNPLAEQKSEPLEMEVLVNGAIVSHMRVSRENQRLGEYSLTLPATLQGQTDKAIEFKASGRFLLWFVRVTPLRGLS